MNTLPEIPNDDDVQAKAKAVFDRLGVTYEQAITKFLQRTVEANDWPFYIAQAQTHDGELTHNWKEWLATCIFQRCKPLDIVEIMQGNNFSLDTIRNAMGDYFPSALNIVDHGPKKTIDYEALCEVALTRARADEGVYRIDTLQVQMYYVENFMSHEECDALIKLIGGKLRPSITGGKPTDSDFRSSRTSDLALIDHPLVHEIDQRICQRVGINAFYSDSIEAQHYAVGQQFKHHHDYFTPGHQQYAIHAGERGNRTWTFMVYLNEPIAGGATDFPYIGKRFTPVKGVALAWNNLYPDGEVNPDTMHSGMPIEEGEKIVITKWFRELGRGPMFIT